MWKKEFVDLLYPTDHSKINVEQAMRLKYKNIPVSLFKYKSFDECGYSIAILEKDEIRLETPNRFNDPFDCSLTFTMDQLDSAVFNKNLDPFIQSEFSEREIDQLRKSDNLIFDLATLVAEKDQAAVFAKAITKFIENEKNEIISRFSSGLRTGIYVTCFSESKDSILMWSHYADYHRGFCIEYDFSSLDSSDHRTQLLYPVIYTDSLFDATEYLRPVFEGGDTYNNLMATYAAITKSTDWSYEKEWRYVLPLGPSNDLQFFSVPKPKAIYLGAKVSNGHKENVIKLATKRGIKVYQMAMKRSEFKLVATNLL